jgi:hypothetical protein
MQPIAVVGPAALEAVEALLGTQSSSPRIVPDKTELAVTHGASHGSAMFKTFGAVGHDYLHSVC